MGPLRSTSAESAISRRSSSSYSIMSAETTLSDGGESYYSDDGAHTTDDGELRKPHKSNLRRQSQQRTRKPRRLKRSAHHASAATGSWLWAFLTLGLVFCLIDFCYIFKFVMDEREDNDIEEEIPPRMPEEGAGLDVVPIARKDKARDDDDKESNSDSNDEKPAFKPDFDPDDESSHILNLLTEAKIEITEEVYNRLPAWSDVTDLYGKEPVFIGLDTCEAFQNQGDPAEHFLGTAGTFNTGTNLMAELLLANCHLPARTKKYGAKNKGVRWQVLWGKHTPVGDETIRTQHTTYENPELTAASMFPAVTVRDPYKWLQSMCRHPYEAKWKHSAKHCPNLLPNEVDFEEFPWMKQHKDKPVQIRIKYNGFEKYHDSLVHFWNEWYQDYVNAQFPRLIVRFEDVVFFPKQVTETVCHCAGGKMRNDGRFIFVTESAKKGVGGHGPAAARTSYVDAIVKYGTRAGRYAQIAPNDLTFADQHWNRTIFDLMHYQLSDQEYAGQDLDAEEQQQAEEEEEDEDEDSSSDSGGDDAQTATERR